MMKKSITIIDYLTESLNILSEQLKNIFKDTVLIKKMTVVDLEKEERISSDIILMPSYSLYNQIKYYFDKETDIVIMSRTISNEGFDKLKGLRPGNNVYLVEEIKEMADEICCVIYQLGVRHFNIIPLGLNEFLSEKLVKDDILITLNNGLIHCNYECNQINIGNALLDINTIIEIGIRLDMDNILTNQDLRKAYKEIITSKIGLALILNKANRYSSQVKVLLDSTDDGIIEFNTDRKVVLCNKKATEIIGRSEEKIMSVNACELLRNISINKVYEGKQTIIDELIKINNKDIITSVYPLLNTGRFYGAVAIIKEFREVENKQHKIREKIIGKGHRAKYTFYDIIGNSERMNECKSIAKRMAKSNSSILITGETGTGKELFAQAIHNESSRKDYQFVVINCGALPANILESELFGYEEGSFTGARKGGKLGLFELAHEGTIFLDEIAEMPQNLQMKLLRVLQEKEIMRLGSDKIIDVDIRVIAATNKNLEEMVRENKFREDLYYRLKVLPLTIPPLRDRVEDILGIFEYYKNKFNGEFTLSEDAKNTLLMYNWNGNIRELRNFVEYLVNIGKENIQAKDIPIHVNKLNRNSISNIKSAIDEFVEFAGKNIDKYVYVLKILSTSRNNNDRIGRRSIYKKAQEDNNFLGEQEIRRMLIEMESYSLVRINKGRGGSVVTDLGVSMIQIFERSIS